MALATLLALSGCWVTSLNGLDEGGSFASDADRVFEPALLGSWILSGEDCEGAVQITAKNGVYQWQMSGEGTGCDDKPGKYDYYESRLFKLDNHYFLDQTARDSDVCEMCIAIHWIFLLQLEKDSFTLIPIDDEWLKAAVEQKSTSLPTMADNTDMITASPKELKAFCRKYADDREVFKPTPDLTFRRK
ncbi:MAG TPA: hypothetical protein VMH04_21265 [Candidatus Solibacter sp.]|nr:hypothetical protein [Candidatus Solibacter sp.]